MKISSVSPENGKQSEINGNVDVNSQRVAGFSNNLYTADEISALLKRRSNHEDDLRRVSL